MAEITRNRLWGQQFVKMQGFYRGNTILSIKGKGSSKDRQLRESPRERHLVWKGVVSIIMGCFWCSQRGGRFPKHTFQCFIITCSYNIYVAHWILQLINALNKSVMTSINTSCYQISNLGNKEIFKPANDGISKNVVFALSPFSVIIFNLFIKVLPTHE